MVFDPLFGQFVRREFFLANAPKFGDTLVPFFVNQMQTYFQINKGSMDDMFHVCLGNDPQFADYNRRLMRIWTTKWLEPTIKALRDFMGIYALLPNGSVDKKSITESLQRTVEDWIEDYARKIDFKADGSAIVNSILTGLK